MRRTIAIMIMLIALPALFSCASKYRGPVVTDQGTTFRFQDAGVKKVSLIGNFNHWDPEQDNLAGPDKDGWWSITVPLSPGRYEYLYLVNGSALMNDPFGNLKKADEYGGLNSVIFIRQVELHALSVDHESNTVKQMIEKSAYTPEQKSFLEEAAGRAIQQRIPARDVAALVKQGISRNMDFSALIAFLTLGIETAAQDVPPQPVLEKIEEGMVKNKSVDSIQKAAFTKKQRLQEAGRIVDAAVQQGLKAGDPGERRVAIEQVFAALETGIAPAEISKLCSFAAEQKRALPLVSRSIDSITFLTALGMPADLAVRTAQQFIYQNYSSTEMTRRESEMIYLRDKGVNWVDAFYCMLHGGGTSCYPGNVPMR